MQRDAVVPERQTQEPTFAFQAPIQDVSVHGFEAGRNLL